MKTEVKNFIALMIVIRVNFAGQRTFDLRSPLNGYRDFEIVFARKFDVIDMKIRLMFVAMEMIVVEIKWRLSSRT